MRVAVIAILAALLVIAPVTISYAPLMESTAQAQAIPIPPGLGGALGAFADEYGLTALYATWFTGWATFIALAVLGWYEFISLLDSNRPRVGLDSATDDVALLLLAGTNPVEQIYGLQIRAFERQGIPLSTSNRYNQCLLEKGAWGFVADMARQFATPQNNLAGIEEADAYLELTRFNHPDSNKEAIRWREVFDDDYWNAVKSGKIDDNTGFPYWAGKGVQPQLTCPSGKHGVGIQCVPCASWQYINSCKGFGLPC